MEKIVYLFICLFAGTVNATVITFSGGGTFGTNSYTESGFTFSWPSGNHVDVTNPYLGWHETENGSANSFNNVITLSDGGTFDFTSFEIVDVYGVGDLSITGSGGQSFLADATALATHSLNWSSLSWMSFDLTGEVSSCCDYIGIDNVTLNANAVPEPATLTLISLGLAGIGWSRKKLRKA